jgi:hypothetical protein
VVQSIHSMGGDETDGMQCIAMMPRIAINRRRARVAKVIWAAMGHALTRARQQAIKLPGEKVKSQQTGDGMELMSCATSFSILSSSGIHCNMAYRYPIIQVQVDLEFFSDLALYERSPLTAS